MKGYECKMAYDALNKLREEFWGIFHYNEHNIKLIDSKINERDHSHKNIWKIIKSCCETDGCNNV